MTQTRRINFAWKDTQTQQSILAYIKLVKFMEICKFFFALFFTSSCFVFYFLYSLFEVKDGRDMLDCGEETHTEVDIIVKATSYIVKALIKGLKIYYKW